MTAGTEVVCNDVVRKVETEEKCIAGLDTSDLNEVGDAVTVHDNVGANDDSNVGGHGKDDSDDSSYVFVNGSIEVTASDPADKGTVNVNSISPKSDSADEVDRFQKEELGIENGGIPVDPLVLETNGIVNGSAIVEDPDVKSVKDEANLQNGSTVDPLVTNGIVPDVNGHDSQITEEEEQVVKSSDEGNGITNVEAITDDTVAESTIDQESTLNPTETSQVTVLESESIKESESEVTITQSLSTPSDLINTIDRDTDCEVMVNQEQESDSTLIDNTESQVTVDESSKPSEDLESQVIVDESESSESPLQVPESQVTVDESSKPSEDLECQVTADESESSETPLVLESQVTVDESSKSSEDLEVQETADVSESSESPLQVPESEVKVDESSKPSEDLEPQVTAVESESSESPIQVLESEVTVDESSKPSEDLECEVTADEPESESPIKEQECQVPVIESYSIDNQESPVPVDVAECNGNHTEKVDSTTTVIEADSKSEEHQDLSTVDSEVKVEDEPDHACNGTEAVQQSESISSSCTSDIKKHEEMLVLSEKAVTNGELEKSDEILEVTETQTSQTVADEDVSLVLDKKETSEENLENQVEESSETQVQITEPVELETNTQEQIQESQEVVIDNVQEDDMKMEDTKTESTIEAEAPLETETTEPIAHEDTVSQNEVIDETQEGVETTENVEVLTSNETAVDLTVGEEKVDTVAHEVTENGSAEDMDNNGSVTENVETLDDEEKETKVEAYVNPVTVIEFGSIGRHETLPTMQNSDVITVPDVTNLETKPVSEENINDDKVSCVEEINGVQSEEIQIPTSSLEDSVTDVPEAQNEEEEEPVLPYNFLIRIPRYEDEMFKDQIKSAQLQLEEKTRLRDAIRVDIQSKRARLRAINEAFNAAKQEENAAKRLVRLKRQEIDSVQFVINRLKNAESVGDIDHRIYNMEHMIQHETLNLKDEKQFIREIKRLRTLRDQLASNMGSQDEVQQAMEQKDQTEERMKSLRKELDGLKSEVNKAEAATAVVGKKYDELSKKERELQAQFKAADDVRQKAYAHLSSLKKQAYDKNKNFRLYKDDVMAARDFASRGDKDSLHRLCANQVEAFMEQWNNNDEFRNDYVNRCTINATRRQKYFDGNSTVPDDVAHTLPSEKSNPNLVTNQTEAKPIVVAPPVKEVKIVPSSDSKIEKAVPVTVHKNETSKPKDVKKETDNDTSAVEIQKEEEDKVTKEEMEKARKEEELKKQEMEAKLKEQRRLEEKAKATEALERKKRIAEKAQQRAELRARKEAEQKEKEREKRMRKKEKKKAGPGGSVNGEDAASSESSNEKEEINGNGNGNNGQVKKKSVKPPAHFFSKQLKPKPVPPPASIRNRKRWDQWVKLALAAVAILCLFLLGNTGFFLNLKIQKGSGNGNGNGI